MAKKEEATGGRGKQRQRPANKQTEERPSTRTGGRGKQRES
jgi:hypothetical protein